MTFPHSIAEKGLSLGGSDGGVSPYFSFLSPPLTCCLSKGKVVLDVQGPWVSPTSPHITSVDCHYVDPDQSTCLKVLGRLVYELC